MRIVRKIFFLLVGAFLHLAVLPFELAGYALPANAFFGVAEALAEVLERVEDVLRRNFPHADSFKEELKRLDQNQMRAIEEKSGVSLDPDRDKRFFFHIAQSGGQVLGYAVEDTVRGKWGPIHYLLALDPQGRVLDVSVLEYRERRGRPVAERRFLKQFIGKDTNSALRLQKDIQGVTGASISSRGVTDGIRKLVHVFQLFYAS